MTMSISKTKDSAHTTHTLHEVLLNNSYVPDTYAELDPLLEQIGEAKYVLLGEASHGTHEYYTWRTQITKRLIEDKGFSFIAVEGDWPDCYRVNRFVKNYSDAGKTANEVLHAFRRWPTWMWGNWEIIAFAAWLRKHNENLAKQHKVGFYGLDVYSLWESLDTIINYLDKKDPATKHTAVNALKCFEPYSDEEGQSYARATLLVPVSCENEVIDLLMQVRKNIPRYDTDPEAVMSAEQNARVIVNAERYYRAMVRPDQNSWNIRDTHMVDTLNRLMHFHGPQAKAIIWEHNTHIGDARATDMAAQGMVNVGQLVNEQHPKEEVFSVGFGSYKGTVIAGNYWGDDMRVMQIPEAAPGSWEHLLHQISPTNRIIYMTDEMKAHFSGKMWGHRAIGVVYRPTYENPGNYVPSLMPYRYDAFFYLDETKALHPLHITPDGHLVPETFPFGT
jgi:erythromycin esterase